MNTYTSSRAESRRRECNRRLKKKQKIHSIIRFHKNIRFTSFKMPFQFCLYYYYYILLKDIILYFGVLQLIFTNSRISIRGILCGKIFDLLLYIIINIFRYINKT